MKGANKKPLLIATLGYPGSGKTYFSERLAKDFNLFHINSDRIRHEMFDRPVFTQEEHRAVFGFIDWLTEELLSKGMSVIVDANMNKRVHRKKLYDIAEKAKAKFLLVYINTPIDTAEKRILERKDIADPLKKKYQLVDPAVMHRMKKNIEYPSDKEKVLVVNGLHPYAEQVKGFKKWLTDNGRNKNKK